MMRIPAALAAFGLGAAALLCSTAAHALGLGEVEVRSRLNERFAANIPLVAASEADLESLVIEVASPEAFARSGVERPDVVSSLSFTRSGGGIRVTSREPIRDPFLTFIVEARWNGGRLLREYTVLLDPPGSTPAAPVQAPAPVPKPVPAPATPPTLVATPAPTPLPLPGAVAAINDGRYGPVQPGQTLWSIAKAIPRTGGVTQEQMLLALYNGNPQAFAGGDIDHLLKGSLLKVPTVAEAMAIDAAAAREQVLQLRASHAAAPVDDVAAAPAAAIPVPPVTTPAPEPEPEVVANETAVPSAEPATVEPDTTVTDAAPEAVVAIDAAADPNAAVEGTTDAGDAALLATEPPPPAAAVVEPAPEPEPETTVAPQPAGEDGLPWLLIAALVLVVGALIVLRSRGRKRELPVPRRVSSVSESMPVGDTLTDRPRTRPLVDDAGDDAAAEPKPLLAAADDAAPADDAAAAAPSADLGLTGVDAADPMTEADFHLAYGLYDEAAQMLRTAIAADPERNELKVKLAEVYSAAGNAAEFQKLAQGLSGQVSASEWQKVSTMGRAILPDMALFQDPASATMPDPAPSAPLADALRDLSVVDFDLDADVRRPEPPVAATQAPPAAPAPVDPLREALLAPLEDLPPPEDVRPDVPAVEPLPMPEPDPSPPVQKVDLLADIDLSSFDLDDDKAGQPIDPGRVEFTMADLEAAADESLVPEPESEVIGGDEIDTKLDLARAYADMGDADAARTLLDEVVAGGTERQRQDAEVLRGRLGD